MFGLLRPWNISLFFLNTRVSLFRAFLWTPLRKTRVWLRVESWVDSESNEFCLSHELIWIEKLESTLCYESIWSNTWGIHLSHELILSQFLESHLSHKLNRFKSSRYCLSHKLIRNKAFESNAKKRLTKSSERPKRSMKLSEIPRKVIEIEWKPKEGQRDQQLIQIIESWLASNQYSRYFFESWVDLNPNSGKFFCEGSIWIKFQKAILSRKLTWINSCKAIVSHKLSQIKTFWDWVESNKKLSHTHVCSTVNQLSLRRNS